MQVLKVTEYCNNEGTLGFPYWLEDTDTYNSANVFNGQISTLWCNLRDTYDVQIRSMYQTLRSKVTNGLNYNEIESRYEEAQNKWPEAIWGEDAKVKYTDPLTNPAPGKQPTAFYLPMNQGSKEQQRKNWLSKRFAYMDSKWNAGDALAQVIQLRAYAKSNITITPYINLYPSVKFGSYLRQTRGVAGNAYELVCPIDELNDTEIYIYSAPWIQNVGDLSGLKVGVADFSQAINIQEVKLGDASSSYNNPNMKSLTFGTNRLLKKVDVRNCSGLGTEEQKFVDMSNCEILEEAYFEGTSIQGLSLPNGGVLKKLHLPDTMTNITVLNQRNLTEFVCSDYSNVSTVRLENNSTAIDTKAIVQAVPANTRLRLVGFSWEAEDAAEIESLFAIFDTMRGLDEQGNNVDDAQISGTIHTFSLTGAQIASYNARYPFVTVSADHTSSVLTYKTYDGSSVIATETILDGGNGTRTNDTARTATAQYTFTPNGWATEPNGDRNSNALVGIVADRTVYAAYSKTIRSYTVRFIVNDVVVQTSTVQYGGNATYTGATPTSDEGEFMAWNPGLNNITGDRDCIAMFGIVMIEPDLKYLNYTINTANNTITITGLKTAQIVADGLKVITIPDTIQGYHVILN